VVEKLLRSPFMGHRRTNCFVLFCKILLNLWRREVIIKNVVQFPKVWSFVCVCVCVLQWKKCSSLAFFLPPDLPHFVLH
jgi:hypothetical protein